MITCSCDVTTHGRRQLELDIKYPLTGEEKRKHYYVDLYVFCPYQLGMTSENYGVDRFLLDMRSYTRYSTYSIPLQKLVDRSCAISPITRISDMLRTIEPAGKIDTRAVLYELRVLASVYHGQLRDTGILIQKLACGMSRPCEIIERLTRLLADIDMFLKTFRAMRIRFLDPGIGDILRQGFCWADESISLSTEKTLYKLYDIFGERDDMGEARAMLESRLGREQEYRAGLGYPTVADPENPKANELFVYREGVLKKWTDGCMFLTTERAKIATRVNHLLMGIAAGAAMVFAVIATFFTTRLFSVYSVPWAILIVVGYIAKDRIKDILRNMFAACVPRLVADQVNDLIDPAIGRKIGASRARVLFLDPRELPESVRRLRNIEGNVFRDIIPPETVIHFHKDIVLDRAGLMRGHKRLEALKEIIRLRLDSWLANMDDPVSLLSFLKDGRRIKISARRVYHLTIIVGISEKARPDGECRLFRYRLVLTRNGIVRIEPVSPLIPVNVSLIRGTI